MSNLDVEGIQEPLAELTNTKLEKLEVFSSIASTNTYLMSQPPPAEKRRAWCLRATVDSP